MKLYFRDYYVDCTAKRIVIGPRNARLRGRHVTLFFEPRGGRLTPHITRPGLEPIWLPEIDPMAVREFFDELGRELASLWLKALVRTSPEELANDGWELIVPHDEMMAEAMRESSIHKGIYRVNRTLLNKLAAMAVKSADSPLRLPEFVHLDRPLLVARVLADESDVELRWVSYYPYELSEDRPDGWYCSSDKWLQPEIVVQKMLSRAAPQIQEALLQLSRWLRIGHIEEIRAAFRAGGRLCSGAP